jgi:hypothetical protein
MVTEKVIAPAQSVGRTGEGGLLINAPFLLGVLLFFTDRFEWGWGGERTFLKIADKENSKLSKNYV